MRVVSGRLGGRNFDAPRGHRTHPMSDKVRGAIFNMLGDISGLTVLDAFAGSGALSIEALSRGAANAVAIDITKESEYTMKLNVTALGLEEQMEVVRADATSWSNRHPNHRFDILLLDPPYDDIPYTALDKLVRHVADDGIIVLSWPGDQRYRIPVFKGFDVIAHKTYGDAQVIFYKRV